MSIVRMILVPVVATAVLAHARDAQELAALTYIDLLSGGRAGMLIGAGMGPSRRSTSIGKLLADPAIHDFVGLSESAWDFNDPSSIPGFGPLPAASPAAADRRVTADR